MSAVTLERDLGLDPAPLQSSQPARTVQDLVRPGRRSGRSYAPTSKPEGAVRAPDLRLSRPMIRSCEVERDIHRHSSLRLTDRGIATVLVIGAMIAVAALSVIGLTAARVTSEHFQTAASLLAQS